MYICCSILAKFYVVTFLHGAKSSSASATSFSIPNIAHLVSIKLDDNKYLMRVFQFLPILRTYGLFCIVDGLESCPPKYLPKIE